VGSGPAPAATRQERKAVKLIKLPGVKAGFVFGPRTTIFLTSKISNVLSPNLIITHKTEIGTAKGQRLVIAIHLDQSNHVARD
jgi:hypothetical protein